MNDNPIQLDDYARELLDTYASTAKQIRDLDALRVKARDQLMNWFAIKDARRGFIGDEHVVTFKAFEVMEFDSKNFREDQPALWAQYTHPAPRRSLWVPSA